MENFVVSARKYRPSTFRSVVGQQALTTTLKNAILSGRLAHAYLFCGPRGVGKTTCARIFAKTINCMNPTADYEACNECESCRSFIEQRSMNIHELDAASNNSVEDIRNLIAQVRIPPQIGKYSVFIIDEVHMLSSAAFNAFLKTLEEPPSHAIFILATTEKHKILPTILSRCQIYDFSRITLRDIIGHLKYVAQSEGVSVDERTLEVIAQKADGGMRDALSIFDQLVSFSGKQISYESAIANLNVLDTVYYFRLVDYALSGNIADSLLLYDDILQRGFDGLNFLSGFGSHLRNLLVAKDPSTIRLLESSEATMAQYQNQAAKCHPKFIFRAINIVADAAQQYRLTSNKRLCVEIMLMKICQILTPDGGGDSERKTQLGSVKSAPSNQQPAASAPAASEPAAAPPARAVAADQAPPVSKPHNPVTPLSQQQTPQPAATVQTEIMGPPDLAANISAQGPAAQKQEAEAASPSRQSYGTMEYTEQMIIDAWKHYTSQIDDHRISSIFKNLIPQRADEPDKWFVSLYNPLQQNLIEGMMPQVNDYLRRSVSNDNVEISIRVARRDNELTFRPYMPKERLEKMVDENGNLRALIENFNLKID